MLITRQAPAASERRQRVALRVASEHRGEDLVVVAVEAQFHVKAMAAKSPASCAM